jgi:hypothetical protein
MADRPVAPHAPQRKGHTLGSINGTSRTLMRGRKKGEKKNRGEGRRRKQKNRGEREEEPKEERNREERKT